MIGIKRWGKVRRRKIVEKALIRPVSGLAWKRNKFSGNNGNCIAKMQRAQIVKRNFFSFSFFFLCTQIASQQRDMHWTPLWDNWGNVQHDKEGEGEEDVRRVLGYA
jgi:hypothetical protein